MYHLISKGGSAGVSGTMITSGSGTLYIIIYTQHIRFNFSTVQRPITIETHMAHFALNHTIMWLHKYSYWFERLMVVKMMEH